METQDIVTLHVQIFGKVQGVFFRDCTKRKADELNLVGWVRNCPDDTVEAVISGRESGVNKMVEWFHQGSPHSRVERVVINTTTLPADRMVFQVTY